LSTYVTITSVVKLYFVIVISFFVGDVTFLEFVQYVIREKYSKKRRDIHWMPQYKHCNPCLIKYDFIGRYETLEEDAKHVLAKVTAPRRTKVKNTFSVIP